MNSKQSTLAVALFCALVLPQCGKSDKPAPSSVAAPAAPPTANTAPVVAKSSGDSPALITEGLSPSFRAVASHLEIGGASFSYDETGGTMALAGFLDRVLDAMPASERKGMPPGFNVTKVFQMLGLDCIVAKGTSARHRTDNSYHSRSFAYTPGGRKGMVTLTGSAASRLMLLDLAPKDTDLALEFPLYFKEYAREVLGQVATFLPAAEKQKFDAEISQPIPQLGVSIKDILEKTDARVGIYLKLDPSQKTRLSPQAPELPALDGVIVIERLGWLFEVLKPQVMQIFADPKAPVNVATENGVLTIRFNQPMGPPPMDYMPVVRFDPKTDRLVIASRVALFDSIIAGTDKFSQRADFAEAWRDLPTEDNSCFFVSSRLLTTATDLIGEGVKASGSSSSELAMIKMFADWIKPLASRSQALVVANQPDGVLMASNSSIPMMNSSLTTVTAVAVLASLAMPAFSKVQARAVQTNEVNVARQVIIGLKIYAAEYGGKYPVELSELIKAKTLDNESLLMFTDPATKERKPWLYNNKLTDSSPGTEPVIASPSLIGGQRLVGFNDGSVRMVPEDEFKKMRGEN